MTTLSEIETALRAEIRARLRCGDITVRGLARLAGISQPHAANLLAERRRASIATLDRLARAARLEISAQIHWQE